MLRISSDWTLFYKFFLPTVWAVFFGVIVFVAWFYVRVPLPFRVGFLVFYLVGVLLLSSTLLRLKRVECTDEHLYVTNYFKTYRYTYDSIEKVSAVDFIIFKVVALRFKAKTAFGKRVHFLRRRKVWEEQTIAHPELKPGKG